MSVEPHASSEATPAGSPGKGPGVAEVVVADDPAAWEAAGFTVADGAVLIGTTRLRLAGANDPRGVRSWGLRAPLEHDDIDGLPTGGLAADEPVPPPAHPNGAVAVDHIVVGTPHRERTIAALRDQLGIEPRRQTEHELQGRAMVQTFYVLGDLVLELISRPDEVGDGPATFWGLAFTVADLDATAAYLGDALGPPRDAVQPGRRIATLHGRDLGVSVPVAFLSPRR